MDLVKSIGELLHENVLKDLNNSEFKGTSKELCRIHLTFECQQCYKWLPTWKEFVYHLEEHGTPLKDTTDSSEQVKSPLEIPLESPLENQLEGQLECQESMIINPVEKSTFLLPPKKNKLARTEAIDERLRTRKSKVSVNEVDINIDLVSDEAESQVNNNDHNNVMLVKRKRGRPPKRKSNEETSCIPEDSQVDGTPHEENTVRIATRQSKRLIEVHSDNLDRANKSVVLDLGEEYQDQVEVSDDKNDLPSRNATEDKTKEDLTTDDHELQSTSIESELSRSKEVFISEEAQECDAVNVSPASDAFLSLEASENSSDNLTKGSAENDQDNDSNMANMLNVNPEEYAVMSRDQKEDLKARTCPFCFDVLPALSDCLPHYEQQHNFTPKAGVSNNPKEFRATPGSRCIKAVDTCDQCPFCGKFFLKDKIDRHVILVHVWRSVQRNSRRKKPSLCDICGQEFSYVHNLAIHRKTHFKPAKRPKRSTQYVCNICGYSTPERKRLTLHTMSQHENKKAFKCTHPNCSYETWERSSFRCHVYRHSNEKQFKCSYCSYQCIQLKQLRNHLQKQHMVSLPKKYKVDVDNSGKKVLQILSPREKPLTNKKTKIIGNQSSDQGNEGESSKDIEMVPDHQQQEEGQGHSDPGGALSSVSVAQYSVQDYEDMSAAHEEVHSQEHFHENHNSESQDMHGKSQVMDQEYFQQEQVVSEENAPYMLIYPSDMGESAYTSVPQAISEVLVTTNIGEQQVQLHLYPPMSKSGDLNASNMALEPNIVTDSRVSTVTMATGQEVSIETDALPIGMTHQQLNPVTYPQVNFVPVTHPSDVMTACSETLVDSGLHHHHQVEAPDPSSHLVVNSTQQSVGFANNHSLVVGDSNPILQSDSFAYANAVMGGRGHAFVAPGNNTQSIELTQVEVPIMTYSELQHIQSPPGGVQETNKNVECMHNSENDSVEQDIARTLIQINDTNL